MPKQLLSVEDYIEYAKRRPELRQFGENYPNLDARDEDTGNNVLGANDGYDEPAQVSTARAETILSTDGYAARQQQGSYSGTDDDERSDFTNAYGNRVEYDTSGTGYRESNQTSESVRRSTPTVTRKRKSYFDQLVSGAGNMLPRSSKSKSKTVTPTPSAPPGQRKIITLSELAEHRTTLIELVLWTSDNLDKAITAVTTHHREVEIWSDIEYADASIIVDAFGHAAQHSEYWTSAYRAVLDYQKKVKLAVIVAPRTYKTIMYLFLTGIDLRLE